MNRYTRLLLALSLVGALAACAPAADEPSATATAEPMASMSTAQAPSQSASAMPSSHDMGDMDGFGESASVEITNFAFDPADLTVVAGTEVTFTNLDSAPHTVTAGTDDEPMTDLFDSGLLQQGESFAFTFDEPGTYAYFCDRHPPMQASITVEN